jgi:hypothetical protein
MVESVAHLVDHVFPEVPVRQWVLTFPFPLRFLLAAQPEVLSQVLAVVQRGISTFVIRHSGLTVASGARTGAVTRIQRFGSALNVLRCSFAATRCRVVPLAAGSDHSIALILKGKSLPCTALQGRTAVLP